MFSVVGVISTMGDILSTIGVFSIMGGYHEYGKGNILSTVGDVQYRGGIMIYVGDIMSTMGVFSTLGDMIFCYLSASIVLNTLRYSWYPHMYHDVSYGILK